ncbi:MAG: hypothetical protein ACR2J5_01405 [Geodermatophilaceae bacterium]
MSSPRLDELAHNRQALSQRHLQRRSSRPPRSAPGLLLADPWRQIYASNVG